MSGRKSRTKGAVGERELAARLTELGFPARRGRQYSGSPDSPDVVVPHLPGWHWECKRVESGNLYRWLDQAVRDAGPYKTPVVAHRRNGRPWIVVLRLEDFLNLLPVPGEFSPDNNDPQ